MFTIVKNYKESIYFGLALAILFFFVKWLEMYFLLFSSDLEIYIALIAILFTVLGIWIAFKTRAPQVEKSVVEKIVFIDKNIPFQIDQNELNRRKISNRELEVLRLIATGNSNQEIADALFVSLPTVKTHTANLFEKLEAKRRTQAIENAKRLQLLE
jgi:NarL family two-component system response regulator LiaR